MKRAHAGGPRATSMESDGIRWKLIKTGSEEIKPRSKARKLH
jgi:hypothetical protein